MVKFLIQIIKGEIVHDFSFFLKEAIKYNNWYYNENKYEYKLTENILEEDYHEYIPIGSIAFVLGFYKTYHNICNIKPINVPEELKALKFSKRYFIDYNGEESLDLDKEVFAKSKDKFKEYTEIVKIKDLPKDKALILSDLIDIQSEWRAFVFRGKLIDVKNYSGDFKIFPDMSVIEDMVNSYKDAYKAYTLDVAIDNEGNTIIIEVHQFFSCGLYGFNDCRVLPQMFISTHREILMLK